MKFNVKLDDREYQVEPVGTNKVSYRIYDGERTYDLRMDTTGEWICDHSHTIEAPIPIDDLGKEIEKYFG